jgi:hypothetical protein
LSAFSALRITIFRASSGKGLTQRRKVIQLAPLSLHDMLQVMVLPSRQALQAATHWLISRALYLGKRSTMHMRCSSVYSGSLEHEVRTLATAIRM